MRAPLIVHQVCRPHHPAVHDWALTMVLQTLKRRAYNEPEGRSSRLGVTYGLCDHPAVGGPSTYSL